MRILRSPLLLILLLLLAFGLRIYGLDSTGMWWDEGISTYLASLTFPELTWQKNFIIDLHPPLYHVVLSYWVALAGTTPFVLRFLSLAFGVISVAAIYQAGKWLFNARVGKIAALLLTVAPASIYFSQEVRMYSLTILLVLLSILFATKLLLPNQDREELDYAHSTRGLKSGRANAWIYYVSYVVVTTLGLYTLYYVAFVVIAQNLWAIIVWFKERRLPKLWFVAQTVVLALYVPWLWVVAKGMILNGYQTYGGRDAPEGILEFMQVSWAALSVGGGTAALPVLAVSAPFLIALIAGLARILLKGSRRASLGLLFACIILSILLGYAFVLWRPVFQPRMLISVSPMVLLIASASVDLLKRQSTSSYLWLLALLVPAAIIPIQNYGFQKAEFSSEGFREVLGSFNYLVNENDLVIATYAWQAGYVLAYSPQKPDIYLLPQGRPKQDMPDVRPPESYGRTWVMQYDDGRYFRDDRTYPPFEHPLFVDQFYDTRIHLKAREPKGVDLKGLITNPTSVNFAGQVQMLGYDLDVTNKGKRRIAEDQVVQRGELLRAALYFKKLEEVKTDYTVFVHLADIRDGFVRAQEDRQPLENSYPITRWSTNQVVVDRYAIPIPQDIPPGVYQLEIGLYDVNTSERLPILGNGGNKLILSRFEVK